jgi:hypothetical protein
MLDCELDPRSGKPDDYTIGNYFFSVMYQASRSKRKTRNQDNVSECRDISTHGQSFQVMCPSVETYLPMVSPFR